MEIKTEDCGRLTLLLSDQGSPEWHKYRAGKISGSTVDFSKTKGGKPTSAASKLTLQKASERVLGRTTMLPNFPQFKHGHEKEPKAQTVYQMRTGNFIENVGFCALSDYVGDSPDGLVDFDRKEGKARVVLEIKSHVSPEVMGDVVINNIFPSKYLPQILHHFYVFSAEEVHYVSYAERESGEAVCFILILKRADYLEQIEEHALSCDVAVTEIKALEEVLIKKIDENKYQF